MFLLIKVPQFFSTRTKSEFSSLRCPSFFSRCPINFKHTRGHTGPHTHTREQTQPQTCTPFWRQTCFKRQTTRERRRWRMCKVCFPFPAPTLHLRFALSQKGNSVLQLSNNCSLLDWREWNNLKIHNFIWFAVAPRFSTMTDCGVFVQNRDGAV